MSEKLQLNDKKLNEVHYILRDMLKVIKVVSMYPADNPLPVSLRRSFAEKLVSLVETYGTLEFLTAQDRLSLGGETVFEDKSREESLAAIFFDAGITEFAFVAGIEVEEIYQFLEILKNHVNTPGAGKDLAGQLWEAGLNRISFETIEDIALSEYEGDFQIQAEMDSGPTSVSGYRQIALEGDAGYGAIFTEEHESNEISLDDPTGPGARGSAGGGPVSNRPIFYASTPGQGGRNVFSADEVDDVSLKTAEAAEAMGFGDLQAVSGPAADTAMIFNDQFELSEKQEEEVAGLLTEDSQFDPYESTLALLKEIVLGESEMNSFFESITICEKLQTEFVRQAQFSWAARVLEFFGKLQERLTNEKPLWAERVKDAVVTAGGRDRLATVPEALNDNPHVSAHELRSYLNCFGWEAMGAITDLLGLVLHERHQETITDYLTERGKSRIDIISKAVYDKRPHVVRNAVKILSRIGDDRALGYLEKAVTHEEKQIRLDIAVELSDCAHEKALGLLRTLVNDKEPEIRAQAVRSIVNRRGPAAFETITSIINDDGFGNLSEVDQKSLITAYSLLGGNESVGYLEKLITRFSLFGTSNASFFRSAAFDALVLNRGDDAERLLIKLAGSLRPDIKNHATEALKRRRDLAYGAKE